MPIDTTINYDGRFDKLEKQIQSQSDNFNSQLDKLTAIVIKGFDRIGKQLEKKADKKDIDGLYNLMDKIAKQQEINDDERLVMGHQLERLDRWVHEVADKIGYTLTT
ncbi:MAG TPA: hypothetical protein VJR27_00845 [Candidatus Saccharimonadales bacterium]|nr:hypothetical protein [Candidatus Saccharimonadales bacterium]